MTGLHTRGYRPKPGERACMRRPARGWWKVCWWDARSSSTPASAWERLARECLDAREAPDPLDWGHEAYDPAGPS